MQVCRQSAEGLGLSDTAIFMLNNIVEMQSTVGPFDFAASWSQRLTAEIQQWEDTLVKEDAADLLARVGITPKLTAIQSLDGSVRSSRLLSVSWVEPKLGVSMRLGWCAPPYAQVPMSKVAGLDSVSLTPCLRSFYATLFSLSMPTFDRLTSPRLRVRARRSAAQIVANAYVVRAVCGRVT